MDDIYKKPDFSKFKDVKIMDKSSHIAVRAYDDSTLRHMIKDADQDNYADLLLTLQDSGFDTYLAGGVVRNFIYNGKPIYKDIDMVAVGENKDILDMMRQLYAVENNNGILLIKETPYKIKLNTLKKMYVGMKIEENIVLSPVPSLTINSREGNLEKYLVEQKNLSVFDLSMMNPEQFKEYNK